ncbi:acetate/propionate family kinase [Branchiibius sp. NY16-3462-2]|uniref:acetate/propionate family kinase n=1 Tax=Branchiibius sp. NY16-3462-2 TaxID=1807500 RepID=UPI0007956CBC|nr:acetate kinase [Branchiibius sp. NY16-3462-2]KYH43078.1 acetate kinase [Branchiibius sp. NY16-3462-2]
MRAVLVINSGSSSFKYQLIDSESEQVLATGLVERIGDEHSGITHTVDGTKHQRELPIADHTAGFGAMMDAFGEFGPSLDDDPPVVVGHRVVHGGQRFFEPTVITDLVKINIEDLSELAPLHNPGGLQGINAAQAQFPDIPHVAVFDTAFHQTIPPAGYTYAIDRDVAQRYRVRKYGFHGTSHQFVSGAAAQFLDRPLEELRQIVFHLGNGASVTAVDGGKSVETSMGMTPIPGLVMGTRSGDIDPGALMHLLRHARMDVDDIDNLLNKRSGVLGLSGHSDMRDLADAIASGDAAAQAAFDVYIHRLRLYLGAYASILGGVDVIVFTAGVGENDDTVRAAVLAKAEFLGVRIDPDRNAVRSHEPRRISTDDSAIDVLVVPTDEELEIARQAVTAIS